MKQSLAVKTFEDLFAELGERARTRPPGSSTVAALDAGVHAVGKKILEEAGEVWLAAEHESDEALAEELELAPNRPEPIVVRREGRTLALVLPPRDGKHETAGLVFSTGYRMGHPSPFAQIGEQRRDIKLLPYFRLKILTILRRSRILQVILRAAIGQRGNQRRKLQRRDADAFSKARHTSDSAVGRNARRQ